MTFSVLLIIGAVLIELIRPLIFMNIIDNHILSLNQPWLMCAQEKIQTNHKQISLDGISFVREDWIDKNFQSENCSTVIIVSSKEGTVIEEDGEIIKQIKGSDVARFYYYELKPVMYLSFLFLSLLLISGLFHYIRNIILQLIASKTIKSLRLNLVKKMFNLPFIKIDSTQTGNLMFNIMKDASIFGNAIITFFDTYLINIASILGIYIALLLIDPIMALISIAILPIFVILIMLYYRHCKPLGDLVRKQLAQLQNKVLETIAILPIIKLFQAGPVIRKSFESINHNAYENSVKQDKLEFVIGENATSLVRGLLITTVVWYFGIRSLHHTITFGSLYLFINYVDILFQSISNILRNITNFHHVEIAAEQILEINHLTEQKNTRDTAPLKLKGSIQFQNVSFSYDKKNVITNLSFNINPGEKVAIVGQSGAGKTTLFNLITRFYEPEKGHILLDGYNTKYFSQKTFLKHLGIVPQVPIIFDGDVMYNIRLFNHNISDEKILSVINKLDPDFFKKIPNGPKEYLSSQNCILSEGQKQIICLARALVHEPTIILFDESTANMDSEHEARILNFMKSFQGTALFITHRLTTLGFVDRIIVMDQGKIDEIGTHDDLIRLRGKYYHMFRLHELGFSSSDIL